MSIPAAERDMWVGRAPAPDREAEKDRLCKVLHTGLDCAHLIRSSHHKPFLWMTMLRSWRWASKVSRRGSGKKLRH